MKLATSMQIIGVILETETNMNGAENFLERSPKNSTKSWRFGEILSAFSGLASKTAWSWFRVQIRNIAKGTIFKCN